MSATFLFAFLWSSKMAESFMASCRYYAVSPQALSLVGKDFELVYSKTTNRLWGYMGDNREGTRCVVAGDVLACLSGDKLAHVLANRNGDVVLTYNGGTSTYKALCDRIAE